MRIRTGGLLAGAAVALAAVGGCATTQGSAAPAATGLAGSAWRLVEIQSMGDATGVAKPSDPSLYTLSFQADGRLAARLDCNRGMGAWKANPATATEGSVEIGPIAATRAFCPPPSIGDRIAADLEHVRGYRIVDGRLILSLVANGGVLVWERSSVEP